MSMIRMDSKEKPEDMKEYFSCSISQIMNRRNYE